MKIQNLLLIPIFCLSSNLYAENIIGRIENNSNNYSLHTLDKKDLDLNAPLILKKYLKTLTETFFVNLQNDKGQSYPNYYLSFKGKVNGETVSVKQMPTTMSGSIEIHGILSRKNNIYYLNQKEIYFEGANIVNGSSFNQSSIDSILGKKVSILAIKDTQSKTLKVTAMIKSDLYSANEKTVIRPKENFIKGIIKANRDEKINTFLLGNIYSNQISKKGSSFRQTIFKDKKSPVKPGDHALIITLSGRQGDDPGALAGHFAAGMATVKDDMSLDMELWNYYHVPNEKLIISGHNHFIDYYGHLTAGQINYRPTYTLVLYGFDKKTMLKMRTELDDDFSHMRSKTKEFGVNYNCTTESVHALRNQGFKGVRYNSVQRHFTKKLGAFILSPFEILSIPFTSKLTELRYTVQKDPNRYAPRAAFEGYLKNLSRLQKKFKISRADYIFHKQRESSRVKGGSPALGLLSVFYGKGKADEIAENPALWPITRINHYIESLMIKDAK